MSFLQPVDGFHSSGSFQISSLELILTNDPVLHGRREGCLMARICASANTTIDVPCDFPSDRSSCGAGLSSCGAAPSVKILMSDQNRSIYLEIWCQYIRLIYRSWRVFFNIFQASPAGFNLLFRYRSHSPPRLTHPPFRTRRSHRSCTPPGSGSSSRTSPVVARPTHPAADIRSSALGDSDLSAMRRRVPAGCEARCRMASSGLVDFGGTNQVERMGPGYWKTPQTAKMEVKWTTSGCPWVACRLYQNAFQLSCAGSLDGSKMIERSYGKSYSETYAFLAHTRLVCSERAFAGLTPR